MIFSHTLDFVLSRRKTQTRRLARPDQTLIREGNRQVVAMTTAKGHRVVYQVGKTYAIQPARTLKAVAHMTLTGIREEAVQEISEADARAEGYKSQEEFLAAWRTIHGAKADMQQRVWVLEFRLLEDNRR